MLASFFSGPTLDFDSKYFSKMSVHQQPPPTSQLLTDPVFFSFSPPLTNDICHNQIIWTLSHRYCWLTNNWNNSQHVDHVTRDVTTKSADRASTSYNLMIYRPFLSWRHQRHTPGPGTPIWHPSTWPSTPLWRVRKGEITLEIIQQKYKNIAKRTTKWVSYTLKSVFCKIKLT